MMESVLDFIILWLSLDVIIVATGWYMVTTIKPRCPNWWRRTIADDDPTYHLARIHKLTSDPKRKNGLS